MPSDTAALARAELSTERDRIRTQLAQLGLDADNLDDNFADSGQVTAERGELEVLSGSLLEALGEVDHAIEKLSEGGFGICEQCGSEIAPGRLEVMPTARWCMTCAADH